MCPRRTPEPILAAEEAARRCVTAHWLRRGEGGRCRSVRGTAPFVFCDVGRDGLCSFEWNLVRGAAELRAQGEFRFCRIRTAVSAATANVRVRFNAEMSWVRIPAARARTRCSNEHESDDSRGCR